VVSVVDLKCIIEIVINSHTHQVIQKYQLS